MSQALLLREIKLSYTATGRRGEKRADAGTHSATGRRCTPPKAIPQGSTPSLILCIVPRPGSFLYLSRITTTPLSDRNSVSKCPSSSPTKTCRTPGCADTRTNTCSRSRPPADPRLSCGAPRISRISTRPIQRPARVSYGRNPWLGITFNNEKGSLPTSLCTRFGPLNCMWWTTIGMCTLLPMFHRCSMPSIECTFSKALLLPSTRC